MVHYIVCCHCFDASAVFGSGDKRLSVRCQRERILRCQVDLNNVHLVSNWPKYWSPKQENIQRYKLQVANKGSTIRVPSVRFYLKEIFIKSHERRGSTVDLSSGLLAIMLISMEGWVKSSMMGKESIDPSE